MGRRVGKIIKRPFLDHAERNNWCFQGAKHSSAVSSVESEVGIMFGRVEVAAGREETKLLNDVP
jgi:hypothetical protein